MSDSEEATVAEREMPGGLNDERSLLDGWLYCTDQNEEGDFEAVNAAGGAEDLEIFRAHCARQVTG